MRRLLGTITLAGLTLAIAAGTFAGGPTEAAGAGEKPNIILIETDDQTLADLYETVTGVPGAPPIMPNALAQIGGKGVTFSRNYSTYPLSCPSRTTVLTGQYAHNHRVLANKYVVGGANVYCSTPGLVDHTQAIPARLQSVGYRTIHVGRFLNGYPSGALENLPAGWNEWHTPVGERESFPGAAYFGYRLNDNGVLSAPMGDPSYTVMDPSVYFTDVITQRALNAIDAGDPSQPFYLQFDHRAPHEDVQGPAGPQPSPQYKGSLNGIKLPMGGSFEEADISDKPRYVETHSKFDRKEMRVLRQRNQRRLESLRSVDDSIAAVLAALQARGELESTYVIFTADNGFFRGEHRFEKGKVRHYEAASRVPLMIRGPGIPHGVESKELTANIDLGPTILELAGATPARPVDGRSLLPFALDPLLRTNRPILIEEFTRKKGRKQLAGVAKSGLGNYQAIVSGRFKAVINFNDEKELYDLKEDPFELRSLHAASGYQKVLHYLSARLRELAVCDGAACARGILKPPKHRESKKKKDGDEPGKENGSGKKE